MISKHIFLSLSALICGYYLAAANDQVLHRVRRLINGTPVPEGQPWMAVLAYKNSQLMHERPYLVVCGGVLIDANHVLATSHCLDPEVVTPRAGATLHIVLGLTDNTWGATNDVQEFPLDGVSATVTRNPDYIVSDVFENDIAVFTLSSPCQLSSTLQPVDLPPPDIKEKRLKNCQFYGWGVTEDSETDPVFSQYLRTASLKIIRARKCQIFYGGFLTDDHICAREDAFPCFGDSGSPLLCEWKKKTYLIGLNSFRRSGPCVQDNPQVFTRVATFLDFIASVTQT